MKEIKVEKVTLNMGAGKDQKQLEKAVKLLKNLTGVEPVKTITDKRIQGWGLRPGLAIGAKITLRRDQALQMVERLMYAKDNVLKETCFDNYGNISFGLQEYVDIKDAKYDVDIGMTGLQASITLSRPGYRVMRKSLRPGKVSNKHRINKEEAINFMKEKYAIKIGGQE
jgi:large subunit ribosomal protein L5